MELPDRSQARSWEGKDVVDRDGTRLGRCVGVFADTATGVPEWLHVDVEGHVRSFVPALEAAESDGTVRVQFARQAVLDAPAVGDDEQLSKAEEIELYRHYGVPVETGEGSVLPAGDATAQDTTGTTSATSAPVVGTSDRTSTGASGTSGAMTSADGDTVDPERQQDRMGDTTALVPAVSGERDDDAQPSGLSDADSVAGAGVTPETGEQLPVLDPAAASTPVQEDQVTYVQEPRKVPGQQEQPEPAAEQPRPTLRRVPPASPPPQAPSSSGSDLSALTPLGAVAGVAAAVALVLQARDRRARRRASAAARADRLGRSLRAGSSVALASASSALSGVPDAAERTRRSAAATTAKASRAAAQRQEQAAAAARRQRAQAAAALAVASKAAGQHGHAAASSLSSASKAATKAAEQRRKAAEKSLAAAAKTAAQQREAAKASLTAASKSAAQQRKAAKASLAAASKSAAQQRKAAAASLSGTSSRGSSTAGTVAAVPAKVAKRGRKVRKSLARKIWNTVVLGTAGGGYVLGAKAGRERYDELAQVAAAVAASPKVQSATEAVTDPERRADLLAEVQQQAGSLMGRRGEPRS